MKPESHKGGGKQGAGKWEMFLGLAVVPHQDAHSHVRAERHLRLFSHESSSLQTSGPH